MFNINRTRANTAAENITAHRRQLAETIPGLIGQENLDALRAHGLEIHTDIAPTLTFTAKLVPFVMGGGTRGGRYRDMTVVVTMIEGLDVFDVLVYYYDGAAYRGHCFVQNVMSEILGRFIRSLDHQGPELYDPQM